MAARSAVVGGARRGRRCSARSRRRATRRTRCCGVEHQREATDQLAIGNIITSMRLLSSIDWPLFFERVSLVEQILRDDPAGAYARDGLSDARSLSPLGRGAGQAAPSSRSRTSRGARSTLAEQAVRRRAAARPPPSRRLLPDLARPLPPRAARSATRRRSASGCARFVVPAPGARLPRARSRSSRRSASPACSSYARRHGATARRALAGRALVALLPVSELAISLLNLIVTSQVPPRQLPKLDMRDGIPAGDRTMVVVPAIVDSEARADVAARRSRGAVPRATAIRTCTSRCSSDFRRRRRARRTPSDDALVDAARRGIDELNERHGADRFFFFHRERRMERRRAALDGMGAQARQARRVQPAAARRDRHQLHRPARRPARCCRRCATSSRSTPTRSCRWKPARRLVGTLAHPLNRPRFDASLGRVTEGYGILQPRVARQRRQRQPDGVRAGLLRTRRHRSVHDRGVRRLSGSVPRGQLRRQGHLRRRRVRSRARRTACRRTRCSATICSKGSTRAPALCTDIELVDDYPSHYLAFAARQHRWVRGDWQIVRWLWRTVPDASGRAVPNTLPVIARWKILDNLRRSLMPPALVALLVGRMDGAAGLARCSGRRWRCWCWRFPAYIQVGALARQPRARACRCASTSRAERDNIVTSAAPGAAVCDRSCAHQSVVMLDAIGADAVAAAGHAPAPARMGDRRSGRAASSRSATRAARRCGRRRRSRSASRVLVGGRRAGAAAAGAARSWCSGSSRRIVAYVTGPAADASRSARRAARARGAARDRARRRGGSSRS